MATTYYRTGKGSKRHATYYCANARRAIASGDPIRIAADDVANWAPCKHCCTADEVAEQGAPAADKPAAPVKAYCRNSGVQSPRRLYSRCSDCGKEGAVNRKTGTLRAHEPAKQ
jgi:ribosomal protein S14